METGLWMNPGLNGYGAECYPRDLDVSKYYEQTACVWSIMSALASHDGVTNLPLRARDDSSPVPHADLRREIPLKQVSFSPCNKGLSRRPQP
jgi:hypothetical protein